MVTKYRSKPSEIKRVDDLIENNMGLVVQLAKSFMPSNLELLDEYIQLGRIGLWKAILKHDPKRGKLTTIAWNYIRWEIIRHINKNKKHKHSELYSNSAYYHDKVPLWEFIPDNMSELENRVIQLKYKGYTFQEIGYELGCTKSWAYKTFNNIKNKINA